MTKKEIDMLKDEADNNVETDASEREETLGSLLKAAREKQGASIADIAGQLHLRPCIVQDIEADNFGEIASATYVKGYVKNYARIVQADSAAIQACLERQLPQATAPEMQSFSRKTSRQARDGRLMFVTYLIAFILLAMLVLWWVQKSDTLSGIDLSKPTVEEMADSQSTQADYTERDVMERGTEPTVSAVVPQTEASTAALLDIGAGQEERVEHSDTVEAVAVTETNSDIEEAEAGLSALSLDLSGDCWINIKDAKGDTLVNDLKRAGSQLNVSGVEPFKLTLGAPQAVSIELNGKKVNLSEFPSGRVARLTLPEAR
ncbi:RodZ domain-containing protein [uncultured Shewanella sp.]|uniref:RodZ domain-containing protein n=1 Tax=Shewanella atlantica TaxID=271099 RepID=UPI00261BC6BC|nr:RodZ domain-containing protein [uncultured Shewanella sp.]